MQRSVKLSIVQISLVAINILFCDFFKDKCFLLSFVVFIQRQNNKTNTVITDALAVLVIRSQNRHLLCMYKFNNEIVPIIITISVSYARTRKRRFFLDLQSFYIGKQEFS
eukprot:TRINITY_DN30611_c0_g1_i1.p4 TRINITY_DN30611_c0_g1~~TRINITY_DN30611_c0_g1_i1.p4  ORF type:complete len:110 (-),score=7.57 TRINITY_DN30611_c0_g1_i1:464-793(-)